MCKYFNFINFIDFVNLAYAVRSESRCELRHKQIRRKCLRIKLNRFRPV